MSNEFRTPQSANEAILQNILGADNELRAPQSRIEKLLIEISEMPSDENVAVPYLNNTLTEVKKGNLKGVTDIGEGAFYGSSQLENIGIPNSVKSIGAQAFYNCDRLNNISLPDGIESIGSSAFYYCKKFDRFIFPRSVQTISDYVLDDCSNIKIIELKENTTRIYQKAFNRCTSLETLICRAVNPPTLNQQGLGTINDTFIILVPAQSVEIYKSTGRWATLYSDRIFPIE